MKKYKKILKTVLNVIIWVFVIFSLLMTVLALAAQSNADGIPSLGGKCFLTVSSDSMSPTFNEGDLLFGELLSNEQKREMKVGEVITFYADLDGNGSTELNSHRITAVNYGADGKADSYVTKGDNPKTNMVEDKDPVEWNSIIAKWNEGDSVPKVGGFISFLQTPKGFLITIVFPLAIFFLYELYVFIRALLAVKPKKASEPAKLSAEEEEAIKKQAIEEYLRQQAQAQQTQEEQAPASPAEEQPEQTENATKADSEE